MATQTVEKETSGAVKKGQLSRDFSPGQRDTVIHALQRATDSVGDQVFVDISGETVSYAEVDRRSTRFAHALQALKVEKGDTVVSIFDTNMDVFTCWFGINKLGAIWVPINTAYEHEFLRHQIADSKARLLICEEHYLERVIAVADKLSDVELILCRGNGPYPDCPIPIQPLDDHRGTDETALPVVVDPADLACLIYTSGTTGPAKGCMVSHNYMCMWGRQQRRVVPQEPDESSWTPLPLFHSAALGYVMGALVAGYRCAVWPRFSVTTFWEDIEASGASNALLMASIFPLVAQAPDNDAMKRCFGQLKMIYGMPITPELRDIWMKRFGVKLVSSWSYGLTECGTRMTSHNPDETPPETSAGRAMDEFEVRIFDEVGEPVPDGTVGEIVARPRYPNSMFEGYWGRPEATIHAWRNLWLHSGDLGRMEHGWLFFADRAKDYLRARGENISSFEVERTFMLRDEVAEVAVHAISAQDGEDEIKATIVLREGQQLDLEELCRWSIDNLPHFAVPRYYEFRTELPKNPTGKIMKYRLRDDGITKETWDREDAGIVVRRKR